jgi:hypothetical protein
MPNSSPACPTVSSEREPRPELQQRRVRIALQRVGQVQEVHEVRRRHVAARRREVRPVRDVEDVAEQIERTARAERNLVADPHVELEVLRTAPAEVRAVEVDLVGVLGRVAAVGAGRERLGGRTVPIRIDVGVDEVHRQPAQEPRDAADGQAARLRDDGGAAQNEVVPAVFARRPLVEIEIQFVEDLERARADVGTAEVTAALCQRVRDAGREVVAVPLLDRDLQRVVVGLADVQRNRNAAGEVDERGVLRAQLVLRLRQRRAALPDVSAFVVARSVGFSCRVKSRSRPMFRTKSADTESADPNCRS